jgi:uncharacterized protein YkwD
MRLGPGIRRVAVAVALCAGLAVSSALPASASVPEHTMAGMVNSDRSDHGVASVTFQTAIADIARHHSKEMVSKGALFHSCLDCLSRNHGWQVVGENVGYASTLSQMNSGFMGSPEHRRNILCDCFTRIGIGVVRAGGYVWVTEIFYRPN